MEVMIEDTSSNNVKEKNTSPMSMSPLDSEREHKKRRVEKNHCEQEQEGGEDEQVEKKDESGGPGGGLKQSGEEEEKAPSTADLEEPNDANNSEPEDDFLQKPTLAETSRAASLRLFQRIWSQEDEVTILKAIIKYLKANNVTMSDVDMKNMAESIKGSCQFQFVPELRQVRDKIWKLKRKYCKNLERADRSNMVPHEKRIFKLSKKVWVDLKNDQEISSSKEAKIRELLLLLKDFERMIRKARLKLESIISSL